MSKPVASRSKAKDGHQPAYGPVLRRMREHLGLSQLEMASKLGVKLPTLRAYEYGILANVPSTVIEAARKLTVDPEYSYITALYGGRPMPDIAREWARRMGVKEGSPTALAAALGINKSNTSRWLNPKADVKLTPQELMIYERRVAREEKHHRESLRERGRDG